MPRDISHRLILLLCVFAGCSPTGPKNPQWAQPLADDEIPNFHRVSADLYRGGQPTAEGFRHLAAQGVHTVINVRRQHSDQELLAGTGLQYVEIPCTAWDANQIDKAAQFLRVLADANRRPVFVHCNFGGDRTGMMVAAYRLAMCGWSKQQAMEEMTAEQFEYHDIWDDLTAFINNADVADLRHRSGL